MGITAISGPQLVYGQTVGSTGNVTEYNEERGPSLYDLGSAFADPRYQYQYSPGSAVGTKVLGFFDNQALVDYTPFAINSSAIAVSTANAPVAGTALTLTPSSVGGTFTTTIIAPESGQAVSVIAIDSTAAFLSFGSGGTVATWNPAAGTGRAISVINSSNANSEQYIINGRDMYGFKMTETAFASTTSTGTGGATVTAIRKAFKYITSVIPSTATTISATGVRIGFLDVFGFPLVANQSFAGVSITVSTSPMAPSLIALTSVNGVIASTATTLTATTADTRGTFQSSLATNGTSASIATSTGVRVTIAMNVTANMAASITSTNTAGMLGATHFSNF